MTTVQYPYVTPLGVAAALPAMTYANTYLAVVNSSGYWLVDCADSPITRLHHAGLDPLRVQGVFLTHFHPDHIYGFPAYILGLALLLGETPRATPLPVYAHSEVIASVRALMNLFAAQGWLSMVQLEYHAVAPEVGAPVAQDAEYTITAAPGEHTTPTLAVRFERRDTERAFVYSSDTRPSTAIESLARGATLLFHESTDSERGHTRPAAAGALATRAGVAQLVLIHYPPYPERFAALLSQARSTFHRPVSLAEEFAVYPW